MEGGIQALNTLWDLAKRPTAILCHNDMTAIGVIREAYEKGISVPQELSVVGFDNIRLAQFITPPLTTVEMSQTELAQLAFNALLEENQRDEPAPHGTEYVLDTHLVLRKSTAMCPTANRGAD
jgi:LacI family transcriptional regulator